MTPPIIIQTPEPTRGVVVSASFENFGSGVWFQIPIDLQAQQPGALDITVERCFSVHRGGKTRRVRPSSAIANLIGEQAVVLLGRE